MPGRPVYVRVAIPSGPNEGVIYGSGILINKRYVLTAAHGVTPHLEYNPTFIIPYGLERIY